ncbi:hypothetical protein [Amycolatopsis sp. FDAARGOS 1241]|uniref:hypothetical protein n=1 Tax=Amycolatopsis sp. FDAARGOS 1241 TaxID=2778070 RepID=UPI00195205BB|nr:hypothetical protein [Amycolatopsis sp. FDAARGOS 1241]QRP48492.1 hypothetical protein I6J71_11970 [Amycolatopsis sp. FDAARGOS 1241]
MNNHQTGPAREDVHRGLLIAAVSLIGASAVLGMAGLAVFGSAVVVSGRHWARRVELTPAELAKLKWSQAKSAASAGSGAWREHHHPHHHGH